MPRPQPRVDASPGPAASLTSVIATSPRTARTVAGRLLLAAAAVVLVSAYCAPAGAARVAYPCSYGTPGRTVLHDDPPEGRPYAPGSESLAPAPRKYAAMTTANADGHAGRCECVQPRPWDTGMPAEAAASIRSAMDAKEAEASSNYARFGIAPDAVPVEARTIWLDTAWRSRDEQTCIYSRFGPGWAARPGTSIHETGVAVDLEDWGPATFGQDGRLLYANGWCRTVPEEPWHYEYRPILEAWGRGSRCK